MDFNGYKQDGNLWFPPAVYRLREQYISDTKDGTQIIESIVRQYPDKTHAQVKTHFGLVVATVLRHFEDRGVDLATLVPSADIPPGLPVPKDVVQDILYATCNDVGDDGDRKTLSEMNRAEAGRFFDKCRNYLATKWFIQVPDPDPNWKLRGEK